MKTRTTLFAVLVALLILPLAATVYGQGTTAGNLTGTVTGTDGSPLPGVTVKATSPAQLGARTTTSGANGDFLFKNLTPGVYTVNFSMEGMATVERTATVELGGNARSDAKMEVATTTETISVTGEAPSILETTTSGLNLQADTFNALPIGRAPTTLADLSPGLTNNTPVAGQVTINGALAYDTAQLINGVNVMDPIFGNTNALYIEDAIAETQVMTSGISAEFGGFTGGVINTITKSGGNQFKGSARANLDKPNWRDETPFEKSKGITREGDMNKNYEATLGGRIVTDRLWFFAAGRQFKQDTAHTLAVSGLPYTTSDKNPRYELKLTGNITDNHSLQVSYIKNDRTLANSTQLTPVDLRSIYANDKRPNDGLSTFYTGVLSNDLVAELRYSQKKFEFAGLGGTGKNLSDSPFYSSGITTGASGVYNAPYFDATDPENRDNKEYAGSLSYFLSTSGAGSHDMKLGVDRTTIIRTGGNSQSSTNEVYGSDFAVNDDGAPIYDAAGRLIPLFIPGVSTLATFLPTRGAELDISTDALFFNDHWRLDNWTFNLGARYEKVRSKASGGINTVNTDTLVPRLGLSWDPWRNGAYKFDVTYAQYSGRYNPTIFGRNTPVGNPLGIYAAYVGPEGQGIGFAPGLDPANYETYRVAAPTQNIFFNSGLKSPTASEVSLSFGFRLPHNGAGKLTFVDRDTKNFIDDFVTRDNGCAEVIVQGGDFGCFDKVVYKNTDVPTRKYQGLQVQVQEQFTPNWMVAANWTYQIKNDGTYEGEGGQSIGTSAFGNRPEIYPINRVQPDGHLANYQKHKGRLWTNYNVDMHAAGSLGIGAVVYYDSATTFSYTVASVSPTSTQVNLNKTVGYKQLPLQTVFYGSRGAGSFNDTLYADLAFTYQIPVFRSVEPWVKFTIANVTNEDKLVTFRTGIKADPNSPKDAFGLPTGFTKLSTFGTASGNTNYLVPREYLIALGIHF